MSLPAPAADRFEALGRGASLRRKPPSGPSHLTTRHHLLISYMIDGCQHPDLLARIKRQKAVIDETGEPSIAMVSPEVGEPLTLIEAADLLRIRRRNARELHGLPIFQKAYNAAIEAYRNGERAASVRTMVEVRDDPGLGKAADRKVRLTAAAMIMGEAGNSGSTNVVVNNTVGIQQTPGIVIDLRDDDETDASIPHEGGRADG